MTASIRILTTSSLDSNPSLLIISPDGSKTLINCGEGCQRSFLESASVVNSSAGALRVSSVNRICLTHIDHDSVGGLPGMILTTADVVTAVAKEMQNNYSLKNAAAAGKNDNSNNNKSNNYKKNNGQQNHASSNNRSSPNRGNNHRKRNGSLISNSTTDDTNTNDEDEMPDLEIVGPQGTNAFLHSLRHFMRRDRFKIRAHEGRYDSSQNGTNSAATGIIASKKKSKKNNKRQKKNKNNAGSDDRIGFRVRSIPIAYDSRDHPENNYDEKNDPPAVRSPAATTARRAAVSYLFSTPPLPGKFLIQKALALNIPKGPMYAKLKGGHSVTFVDPTTDEERTVHSAEVVEPPGRGVGVAVIYCPTLKVLSILQREEALEAFYKDNSSQKSEGAKDDDTNRSNHRSNNNERGVELDAMVHLTPEPVFRDPAYRSWCERFGSDVDHIALHSAETLEDRAASEEHSPFVSGICGGVRRSFVHDGLFPVPASCPLPKSIEQKHDGDEDGGDGEAAKVSDEECRPSLTIVEGRPMMDYVLMPRSRRGLNESIQQSPYSIDKLNGLREKVNKTGAVECAAKIVANHSEEMTEEDDGGNVKQNKEGDDACSSGRHGELIFTGTGSAVPCKHRNVTGMYLRMNNGNGMLLDVGEGTVGQLLRSWKSTLRSSSSSSSSDPVRAPIDEYTSRLRGIKAVWISHPHADHHLGLLRLLSERSAVCGTKEDPIVLMAPRDMFDFLSEYQSVVPRVRRSYVAVECSEMIHGRRRNPLGNKLHDDLGITYCAAIPVAHCRRSHAVVIDGTSFGRVAYSGDCRPSDRFADAARGADLLIHEATFEDGMEEDAVLKRHSTVGEAIGVAGRMEARAVVLTHFSQRYPKIPPLNRRLSSSSSEDRRGGGGSKEDEKDMPIAFAFDFMRLTPRTIGLAAKLTPALRLLYPGEEEGIEDESGTMVADNNITTTTTTAKDLMAVPGVFAAKGVL